MESTAPANDITRPILSDTDLAEMLFLVCESDSLSFSLTNSPRETEIPNPFLLLGSMPRPPPVGSTLRCRDSTTKLHKAKTDKAPRRLGAAPKQCKAKTDEAKKDRQHICFLTNCCVKLTFDTSAKFSENDRTYLDRIFKAAENIDNCLYPCLGEIVNLIEEIRGGYTVAQKRNPAIWEKFANFYTKLKNLL
jgi:hypothetical protein